MQKTPADLIQEAILEDKNPRPAFDIVIPGEIRSNPNLSRDEKYLYAVIRNLTRREGYCWATNAYLAEEMGVSDRTIKNWLSHLRDEGAIETEVINYQMMNRRRIWITGAYEFKKSLIRKSASPPTGNVSPRSGNELPDDRETSFTHTEESKITEERKNKKEVCVLFPHGKHVRLKEGEMESLVKEHGAEKVDRIIQEINDYISSRGLKPYSDYAATIRNWIRRQKDMKTSSSHIEENVEFAKKLKDRFPNNPDIRIEKDGIFFDGGPMSQETILYTEKGFIERVKNKLRKWNLPLGDL